MKRIICFLFGHEFRIQDRFFDGIYHWNFVNKCTRCEEVKIPSTAYIIKRP